MEDNEQKKNVGFASFKRRVSDLPKGKWTEAADPAPVSAAPPSEARAKPAGSSFDDGSRSAPWNLYGISWKKMLVFGAIVVAILFSAINRDPSPRSGANPQGSEQGEQMPPAGANNVLSTSQIRFCEHELVRLNALKGDIDNWFTAQKFQARVSQFKGGCMNYRYRKGTLEQVKAETAAMKPTLENEAKAILASWNLEFNAWIRVDAPDGKSFFHKRSTLQKEGDIARGEFLSSDKEIRHTAAGAAYKSVKSLRYFNCSEKKAGTAETVYFSDTIAQGHVVEATPQVSFKKVRFAPVETGSTNDMQMKLACVKH